MNAACTRDRAQACVLDGLEPYTAAPIARLPKAKTIYVVAWWRRYAEETAERLPDQPYLMTPCRPMVSARPPQPNHPQPHAEAPD